MPNNKLRIVILISGNGSNLQAIIDACNNELPIEIAAVISNQADAYGLERAKAANIAAISLPHQHFESREAFDQALQQQIDRYNPQLVVLAGFMRRLTKPFVQHYQGRIINIHPSLLPKYPGLNTHQRALDAGDTEHGVSIHYVTEDLDAGPIIAQAKCNILSGDTADDLKKRIQQLEHQLYPKVLDQLTKAKGVKC